MIIIVVRTEEITHRTVFQINIGITVVISVILTIIVVVSCLLLERGFMNLPNGRVA